MDGEQIFRIAFWLLFGALLVMRSYFSFIVRRAGERLMPDKKAIKREGWGMFVARIIAFLILIGLLALYAINSPLIEALTIQLPDWLRWTGPVLGLASLVLWAWAQAVLGKQWSTSLQLRKEHLLVTTGPYAFIRHPIYTAMFGWGIGVALLTANILFALLAIVMIIGILIRVPKEEQMMVGEFGDEYKKYMKKTRRFFPGLS